MWLWLNDPDALAAMAGRWGSAPEPHPDLLAEHQADDDDDRQAGEEPDQG